MTKPEPQKRKPRARFFERDPFLSTANCPGVGSSKPLDLESRLTWTTSETQTVRPNERVTWYVYGPINGTVRTKLSRLQGTGGHHGHRAAGSVGTLSPATFRLTGAYPQNIPVIYTAPVAAGLIRIEWLFSDGTTDVDFNEVKVDQLMSLPSSNMILLVGATAGHPDNHYGTANFIRALQMLASTFYSEFGKPIAVNDMSLAWGGLFDINSDWSRPHATHNIGRHADIRSQDMSEDEKSFFRHAAASAHLRVDLEFPGTRNEHWHVAL